MFWQSFMPMPPVLQVLFGVNQRLRVEDVDSPLVTVRPVKSILLACVTGDRGLCGGYNNNVIKKVRVSGASRADLSSPLFAHRRAGR